MKTKIISLIACMLLVCVLATSNTMGQQLQSANAKDYAEQTAATTNGTTNYTYKIFQAPNKMFGYDILRDGKIIFHQGASPAQPSEFVIAFSKKEQAEKAALLSIEKIKKNWSATLTRQELKNIIAKQNQSQ